MPFDFIITFTHDKKGNIEGRTKVIFDNTIEFLRAHQIIFPFYYQTPVNESMQVFGKLESDYTHTIIKKIQDGEKTSYSEEIIKFDPDKSERDFLDAEEITKGVFEEQLNKIHK
jgi:hypothetical protein